MQTILVAGASGYVGRRISDHLGRKYRVLGVSRPGETASPTLICDLADRAAARELAERITPDAIVHAAGDKNIAHCAADSQAAYRANCTTVETLRDNFPQTPLIYVSTDYVFAGDHGSYAEDSPAAPLTNYGLSKLSGELAGRLVGQGPFVALRTSALYDNQAAFLTFLHRELGSGKKVECYINAEYSPTYRDDLLQAISWLLENRDWPPVLHVCGERTSRFEFAQQFAAAHGYDVGLVRPATLGEPYGPLFPDLSMSHALAGQLFGYAPTPHLAALQALREEGAGRAHS